MKNRLFLPFVCLLIGAFAMSLLYPQTRSSPGASERVVDDFSGWHALSPELWSYYSADAPSYVVEIDSTTDLLTVGMRVRLKQDSGIYKYFGINKVEISPTNTYLTLYGGTNYTLANETITEVAVSNVKAPYGFPLEESYWSVVMSDATDRTSTTFTTVHQVHASHDIDLPIGSWKVGWSFYTGGNAISSNVNILAGLSTSASSFSSNSYLRGFQTAPSSGTMLLSGSLEMPPQIITVSTKTTLYLVISYTATGTNHQFLGSSFTPTIIRAVWAYL